MLTMIDGRPPWYYCFYFGTVWSIVFMAAIVVGALVFFIAMKKQGKSWHTVRVVSAVVAIIGILATLASLFAFV